jgi:hypothetical protein
VCFAPETVRPETERFPPEATEKILKLPWLPLMVRSVSPGPVIVSAPPEEAAAITGNAEFRVMVPVTLELKVIRSSVFDEACALTIATLREPAPSSLILVTTKLSACTVPTN